MAIILWFGFYKDSLPLVDKGNGLLKHMHALCVAPIMLVIHELHPFCQKANHVNENRVV